MPPSRPCLVVSARAQPNSHSRHAVRRWSRSRALPLPVCVAMLMLLTRGSTPSQGGSGYACQQSRQASNRTRGRWAPWDERV